ncbi:D-glycerate dehydrogenase [Candidatus Bathyarchaeota archaeon]|nr:D-glycerate dehydrogenase [Candidatus Bathyarchaeota archaeon]
MAKPKVYVTSNEVPEKALQILRSVSNVKMNLKEGPPTRQTLLKEVSDVEGLFCLLTEKIDSELMDVAKRLKVVANMAVGYDNIDVAEATKRGIMVTNTPGILTETTADETFALLLAIARRIVEADKYVRAGKWIIPWSPMMMVGNDVHGKTLGIYGLGRIGVAVAKRARGFEMKLIYYDAYRNMDLERELGVRYMPLDDVLRQCDYLVIHVPFMPETRHSINKEKLSLMKKTAYLINTSRGAVVDEQALVNALQENRIAGAALDVFEKEPIDMDNPLIKLNNVVIVPHIASASIETRTSMAELVARNIVAALKNETPPTLVNKEVLKARG